MRRPSADPPKRAGKWGAESAPLADEKTVCVPIRAELDEFGRKVWTRCARSTCRVDGFDQATLLIIGDLPRATVGITMVLRRVAVEANRGDVPLVGVVPALPAASGAGWQLAEATSQRPPRTRPLK